MKVKWEGLSHIMEKKMFEATNQILVNGTDYPIHDMENKKCLKPPTRKVCCGKINCKCWGIFQHLHAMFDDRRVMIFFIGGTPSCSGCFCWGCPQMVVGDTILCDFSSNILIVFVERIPHQPVMYNQT